jgi:Zn-dependent protease with chaperone function
LAARANIKVPTTFVITKKAFSYLDKINASSCGDRYHSALCVGSWVLENMTNEELESMLAREIVHIKEDHSFNGEIFYAKVMGPALLIVVLLAQVNFFKKAFGFIGASTSKLAELTALGAVAWGLAYLPAKRNSRKQNQEADIGALELTGHKKLLSALKKMKKWQKKYTAFSYRLGETIPFLFEQSSFAERSKYLRAYDFAR